MAAFAKDLTRLTKGGSVKAHKGKGSQQAPMPSRSDISQLTRNGGSMNDYAKLTPMASPSGPQEGGFE